MIIGLCYDLRDDYLKMGYTEEETAEFDRIGTIEAIEKELRDMGHETRRIGHIKSLTEELVNGQRWDMVFNICEGLYGTGREAQVPSLLDAYRIPYVFSGPLVMAMTLDKAIAKTIVRAAGINTPDYFVVHTMNDLESNNLTYPLFAKPLAEGTGKGISAMSLIRDYDQLVIVCRELLQKYQQPVLVEKFLCGREFTAGIVGTGEQAVCVGVMEIKLNHKAEQQVYSYTNKEDCEEKVEYVLAAPEDKLKCEKLALQVWNAIHAEDAGRVDIRYDENEVPYFLEVNPLAGLHPEHSDLPIVAKLNGIEFAELMRMIMRSAYAKINHSNSMHKQIR